MAILTHYFDVLTCESAVLTRRSYHKSMTGTLTCYSVKYVTIERINQRENYLVTSVNGKT